MNLNQSVHDAVVSRYKRREFQLAAGFYQTVGSAKSSACGIRIDASNVLPRMSQVDRCRLTVMNCYNRRIDLL